MCLYKIDKKTRRGILGWKVFYPSSQYPNYEYVRSDLYYKGSKKYRKTKNSGLFLHKVLKTEQWITDQYRGRIFSIDNNKPYMAGFHVFASYRQAQKWARPGQVICKVLMDDIVASGLQNMNLGPKAIIFVARKIYIEKPK
jgi:hypothetical protein